VVGCRDHGPEDADQGCAYHGPEDADQGSCCVYSVLLERDILAPVSYRIGKWTEHCQPVLLQQL
ncbi:hypothetical protein KIPB_011816, partial [Kipferlia bialata]